ncbi:AAA family ATPase [Sphaerospermopsis aphanizomenoides BCCUSP55]|uniref:AAA family ATPase n=1 Tax=Sphaerospermopsis aphanizomenoides TaxID=459663 RepID=UPI0019060C6B|nr:AAA family ATPase [Sphaerospermopsis aphanizomenoides]MBK1988220.1 AAA family ATPase [Sphaerospermopsis aphanizomenoides BCCUSP55]
MPRQSVPRIEYLRVKNYRALHDLELKGITPLTVFLGPNGSGKSTIFDVFAFLSECFTNGLRKAWDRRGRFRELRTRGAEGPIVIELKYREKLDSPKITYYLAIDEGSKGPYVAEEWLQWRRGQTGKPFKFLDFQQGVGKVITGEMPDEEDERVTEQLNSPELLAVNTLGQFTKHPRVSALRRFITGWYLSYLNADNTRSIPEAGQQERLSETGDNLPNVIQYLKEQHPERLQEILNNLSSRIPRLERVDAEMMQDGRLLLQIKDAPFAQPILAKFASDGTLKMLAYLTVLYDPDPPQLIGIEEPENYLHPRLLPELAEECRGVSANTQLMITTHSPFFVDALIPEELWVLYRDEQGYTQAKRTADMQGIKEFIEHGATLGSLWMEDFFDAGNPLINSGGIKRKR